MNYDLKLVYLAGCAAVEAAKQARQSVGGAVNWARVWCSDAERCESYSGAVRYRIEVSGAAPEAVEFQKWLYEELDRGGFPNIQVITEW